MEESIKQQTKKGLLWKFAEQFSNYGIQFIIGIAMARMLSPEDFGIAAIPSIFITVASVFVGGGFGRALIRKPDLTEEDLSTAFYYSFFLGLFFYVVLFFVAPLISEFYNIPVLTSLIRISSLGFIYGAIGAPQGILLQKRLDFKTPAKVSVICKILTGVIGVTMAFCGYGLWALVISSIVTGIVHQIIIVSIVKWYPKTGWSWTSFRYLWGFGNKMMMSSLLDIVYGNITPLIVGKYYSPADLGVYNRAQGYADMPSKNIHQVVKDVSFPVLSKLQRDPERMVAGYRKMIRVSAFVIFPLMMLLSAIAKPLIIVMITEKWLPCVVLLQIICFERMWYPVQGLNLNILMVQGRSDLFLRLEIAKKILGLSIMCVFLPMGLIPFCYAQIGASIISLYINTWYTGKMHNFGFFKQLKDLLPILGLCLFMMLTVMFFIRLFDNMLLQVILGGLLGISLYIGGALLFKYEELSEVLFLLKRK